jgi:hypothetical protein
MNFIKKLQISFLAVFMVFGLIGATLQVSTVPVHAQRNATDNVIGFTGCNDGDKLGQCVGSILRFAFVIGVFLMAFRIAMIGVNRFNPESNEDPSKAVGEAVRDLIIGVILLGAPSLILGSLNQDLLRLDFLKLDGFTGGKLSTGTAPNTGGGGSSGGGSGGSNTGGGVGGGNSSGGNTNTGGVRVSGVTATQLGDALSNFTANPANATPETLNILKSIGNIVATCDDVFTANYSSCQTLGTGEFSILKSQFTDTLLRGLQIPNIEPPSTYTGNVSNNQNIRIEPAGIPNKTQGSCILSYAKITQGNNPPKTAQFSTCNGIISNPSFMRFVNNVPEIRTTDLPAGSQIKGPFTYIQ